MQQSKYYSEAKENSWQCLLSFGLTSISILQPYLNTESSEKTATLVKKWLSSHNSILYSSLFCLSMVIDQYKIITATKKPNISEWPST